MLNDAKIILHEEKLREVQIFILKQRNLEKHDMDLQNLKRCVMWKQKQATVTFQQLPRTISKRVIGRQIFGQLPGLTIRQK